MTNDILVQIMIPTESDIFPVGAPLLIFLTCLSLHT